MELQPVSKRSLQRDDLYLFLSISIAFVFILFFIDEGHYSLESFTKFENLFPFLLYLIVALSGQIFLFRLLSFFKLEKNKRWISAIFGPVVSIGILIAYVLTQK